MNWVLNDSWSRTTLQRGSRIQLISPRSSIEPYYSLFCNQIAYCFKVSRGEDIRIDEVNWCGGKRNIYEMRGIDFWYAFVRCGEKDVGTFQEFSGFHELVKSDRRESKAYPIGTSV